MPGAGEDGGAKNGNSKHGILRMRENDREKNGEASGHFPLAVTRCGKTECNAAPPETANRRSSQIVFVAGGGADFHLGMRSCRVTTDDVLIIPPESRHSFRNCSDDFDIFRIFYDPEILPPQLDTSELEFVGKLRPERTAEPAAQVAISVPDFDRELLVNLILRLIYEIEYRRLGHNVMIPTMFTELIVYFARGMSNEREKDRSWLLQSPVAYLSSNLKRKLDVGRLARLAGMSERSLFRHFRKAFGMGPNRYLQHLRVQHAVMELKNTSKTLVEIAADNGFCDVNHFGKVFRSITGKTPHRFRAGDAGDAKDTGKENF